MDTSSATPNPEYAGRVYELTKPYQVGREKVAEFARAIGSSNPASFSVEAARGLGYRDVVAPTTFAVIIAQRAESAYITDPDARIDFSRVVHADERFRYHRPIFAGDELVSQLHVDKILVRSALSMVTTRVEISALLPDGSLEAVVSVISTLAVRAGE